MKKFPPAIQDFADQFVELQDKRHRADYDPFSRFTRRSVITTIEIAEAAVRELQKSDSQTRKAFAAWTALKSRKN